jgi:hypothetical protein
VTLSIFAAAAEAGATPAVVIAGRTISFAELGRRTRSASPRSQARSTVPSRPGSSARGRGPPRFPRARPRLLRARCPGRAPPPPVTAHGPGGVRRGAGSPSPGNLRTGGDAPLRGEASHEPRAPAARDPGAAELAAAARSSPPNDDRALVVIATSGSSGAPKAVILSRRAIVASARASAAHLGWEPDDRWLLALPLAHVGGLSC